MKVVCSCWWILLISVAHLDAQLGVQVRERFIEEEYLWLAHDRPPDCHALALSAGELAGLAVQQFGDAQRVGGFLHAALDLVSGHLAQLQPKGHVVEDGKMRIEGVGLKDHRDIAVFRRHIVDHAVGDHDLAFGDLLQPGQTPQSGCLAAAGRADEHEEFLVVYFDVEVVDCHHFPKFLCHVVVCDASHCIASCLESIVA